MSGMIWVQIVGRIVGYMGRGFDASHTYIARVLSEWWTIWAKILIHLTHASQDFGTDDGSSTHRCRHPSRINHTMLARMIDRIVGLVDIDFDTPHA